MFPVHQPSSDEEGWVTAEPMASERYKQKYRNKKLSSVALDYYKKFCQDRDIKQYLILSSASDLSPNDATESFRKSSAPEIKITECAGFQTRERKKWIRPPLIGQDNYIGAQLPFTDGTDKVLENCTRLSSPASSVASNRRLEWDSGADVGYVNQNIQVKDKDRSISLPLLNTDSDNTLTRDSLRMEPEGVTSDSQPILQTSRNRNELKKSSSDGCVLKNTNKEQTSSAETQNKDDSVSDINKRTLPKSLDDYKKLGAIPKYLKRVEVPDAQSTPFNAALKPFFDNQSESIITPINLHGNKQKNENSQKQARRKLDRNNPKLKIYRSFDDAVVSSKTTVAKLRQWKSDTYLDTCNVEPKNKVQEGSKSEKEISTKSNKVVQTTLQTKKLVSKSVQATTYSSSPNSESNGSDVDVRKLVDKNAYLDVIDPSEDTLKDRNRSNFTLNVPKSNSFEYLPGNSIYDQIDDSANKSSGSSDIGSEYSEYGAAAPRNYVPSNKYRKSNLRNFKTYNRHDSNSDFKSSLDDLLLRKQYSRNLIVDLQKSIDILKDRVDFNKCSVNVKKRLVKKIVEKLIESNYDEDSFELANQQKQLSRNVPWVPVSRESSFPVAFGTGNRYFEPARIPQATRRRMDAVKSGNRKINSKNSRPIDDLKYRTETYKYEVRKGSDQIIKDDCNIGIADKNNDILKTVYGELGLRNDTPLDSKEDETENHGIDAIRNIIRTERENIVKDVSNHKYSYEELCDGHVLKVNKEYETPKETPDTKSEPILKTYSLAAGDSSDKPLKDLSDKPSVKVPASEKPVEEYPSSYTRISEKYKKTSAENSGPAKDVSNGKVEPTSVIEYTKEKEIIFKGHGMGDGPMNVGFAGDIINYCKKEREDYIEWIETGIEHLNNLKALLASKNAMKELSRPQRENLPSADVIRKPISIYTVQTGGRNDVESSSSTSVSSEWSSHHNLTLKRDSNDRPNNCDEKTVKPKSTKVSSCDSALLNTMIDILDSEEPLKSSNQKSDSSELKLMLSSDSQRSRQNAPIYDVVTSSALNTGDREEVLQNEDRKREKIVTQTVTAGIRVCSPGANVRAEVVASLKSAYVVTENSLQRRSSSLTDTKQLKFLKNSYTQTSSRDRGIRSSSVTTESNVTIPDKTKRIKSNANTQTAVPIVSSDTGTPEISKSTSLSSDLLANTSESTSSTTNQSSDLEIYYKGKRMKPVKWNECKRVSSTSEEVDENGIKISRRCKCCIQRAKEKAINSMRNCPYCQRLRKEEEMLEMNPTKPVRNKCPFCGKVERVEQKSSRCSCWKRSQDANKKSVAYFLALESTEEMSTRDETAKRKVSLEEVLIRVPKSRVRQSKVTETSKQAGVKNRGDASGSEKENVPVSNNNSNAPRSRQAPKKSALTVKEYLERNRPDFINSANARRQCMADLAVLRELRNEKRKELFALAGYSNSFFSGLNNALKVVDVPPAPQKVKRLFTTEKMKEMTKKKCSQLPEVQQKKIEEKWQREAKANRIMAQIFSKKLQRNVHKGKISLSQSISIISTF